VLEREVDIARADELRPDALLEREEDLLLPPPGEAPARAVVGDTKFRIRHRTDPGNLVREPSPALFEVRMRLRIPEIDFADDGQQRHFKEDRVQPRTLDRDVDLARRDGRGPDLDETFIHVEQAEQVDEVALEEAP
jgi:hypothetical protein